MSIEIYKEKFLILIWYYYPFTEEELVEYKNTINWRMLSNNKNMKWSYELIKKYYDFWDWKALEDNSGVFKSLTLSILFPEKVKPIPCDCYLKLEVCDCITEFTPWKRKAFGKSDEFIDFIFSDYKEHLFYLKSTPKMLINKEQLRIIINMDSNEKVAIHLP